MTKSTISEVVGYPPNYKEIEAKFTVGPKTIFAWGDKIYNPSGTRITKDLLAHEEVHMKQQAGEPEKWWKRYLDDSEFRLDQEAKAYGRQYQYICSTNRNSNFRFQVLMGLSLYLAGPMYGYITNIGHATELIKIYAESV